MRLSLACTNRCLFCAQHGLEQSAGEDAVESIYARIDAGRAKTNEITLTGGEPSSLLNLGEIIAYARSAGFKKIGLQTNGSGLSHSVLKELAEAGLSDLHLSLHGATAEVHDYHVGVPGAFARILAVFKSAASLGVVVVVSTVLTRSNSRVLSGLPRLLQQHRVRAWMLRVVRVSGRAAQRFDATVPRLGMVLPSALHAMSVAQRHRLAAFIDGAPLCLLGPFANRAIAGDGGGSYAESCSSCSVRARCPGFDSHYLERFSGEEAAPRNAPSQVAELGSGGQNLLRMFVGIGEQARIPVRSHTAKAHREARHALPVLRG